MSEIIIFIQVHGRPGIIEATIPGTATMGNLWRAIESADIVLDSETFIFVDEAEDHEQSAHHEPVPHVKHGSRIHVGHCKRIKTTAHFLDKTAEREFAPGARVRTVKEWVARHFEMSPKDAAEHVLQICQSTDRPPSDTPLLQLVIGHTCSLCFDLVPEKRVEG